MDNNTYGVKLRFLPKFNFQFFKDKILLILPQIAIN